jgi:perosamine synthetase
MRYEPGAPAAAGFIPLSVPQLSGSEWKYVKDCFDTGWVSSVGAWVDRFERAVADYVGSPHAVATVSGTAAIHTALLVAGVQPDDEVIVPTLTFIAPANAVRYAGAWPVFAAVDARYWQIDVAALAEYLARTYRVEAGGCVNRHTGRRLGALLPVHLLGHPVDLDSLNTLANAYGVPVVEDATESLGAAYRDSRVGSGRIACFSFNGNKVITTGGGGMIVTTDADMAARARYLTTQAKDDPVEYVHGAVGYNYRLTNVQAAMGVAQLEALPEYLDRKRAIAERYRAALSGVAGITLPEQAPWARHAWWLYTVLIADAPSGRDSRAVLRRLEEQRIQTRPLWQPLHRSPAHAGAASFDVGGAEVIHSHALSLPSSVGLAPADQDRVIEALTEAVSCAS